mmetsp:Transcript_100596/g.284972  ORF Transcript_100596/g.284972 Transcript_100596/m.284972 type:complete len:301 (-) Transcript_100596:121-1023(-)
MFPTVLKEQVDWRIDFAERDVLRNVLLPPPSWKRVLDHWACKLIALHQPVLVLVYLRIADPRRLDFLGKLALLGHHDEVTQVSGIFCGHLVRDDLAVDCEELEHVLLRVLGDHLRDLCDLLLGLWIGLHAPPHGAQDGIKHANVRLWRRVLLRDLLDQPNLAKRAFTEEAVAFSSNTCIRREFARERRGEDFLPALQQRASVGTGLLGPDLVLGARARPPVAWEERGDALPDGCEAAVLEQPELVEDDIPHAVAQAAEDRSTGGRVSAMGDGFDLGLDPLIPVGQPADHEEGEDAGHKHG